jgi:hypothetical protein
MIWPFGPTEREGKPMHGSASSYRNGTNFGEDARRIVSVLVLATSIAVLSGQSASAQPQPLPQPLQLRSEVEVGVELAKFTISLNDFVQILQHLSGAVQDQQLRALLKEMITEVRKSYDTVVNVFTPFIALDSEDKFNKEFGMKYADFTNNFLRNIDGVRTHSTIVTNQMIQITNNLEWKQKYPILWRHYERLKRLTRDWTASDVALATAMNGLLHNLDELFQGIAFIKTFDQKAAFEELRQNLELYRDNFLSVKKKLDELDIISRQL